MNKRLIALIGAGALASVGVAGLSAVADAQPAEAAGCSYSNLTSKSVKNVNCTLGAYGVKASANATVGTRIGAWVSPGKLSYNPTAACYQYPTMVHA